MPSYTCARKFVNWERQEDKQHADNLERGRLIFCFLPEKRVFKIKAISIGKYFVWFDILAFIVQAAGAIMTGPGAPSGNKTIGLHVYQAGIGVQQAFILFFFAVIIGFHKKMVDLEKMGQKDPHGRRWRWLTYVLYFVLILITVRDGSNS